VSLHDAGASGHQHQQGCTAYLTSVSSVQRSTLTGRGTLTAFDAVGGTIDSITTTTYTIFFLIIESLWENGQRSKAH
jgi:hypothetical protein